MLRSIDGFCGVFLNIAECFLVLQRDADCFIVLRSVSEYF